MYQKLLVCFVWLLGSGFYALNERKPTVFLIGDSTVSTFEEQYQPMTGWGHRFHEFFTGAVTVDNRAIAGKSSRSFIEEGKWAKVLRDIQKGDYLFIQFGHNDQKKDHRYSSPYTTYQGYLTQYIRETRKKGGIPVLVTSVMRRRFRNGKLYDTHGEYPKAVRQLADRLDVPMIDLHQRSFKHFDQLGEEATKKLFMWLKPGEEKNYPQGREDNTHFSRYGAKEVAALVVDGLKTLDLPLKEYLKDYQPPCHKEITKSITICQGESARIAGRDRTQSGTYREDLGMNNGCHVTRVVTLKVNPTSTSSRTITLCEGESRVLGGKERRTAGTYYDTYQNRLGCDSVVTTRLIINPVHKIRQTQTVCQGDSIKIGNRFRTKAGEYRHTYQNRLGCDSTVITQLIVRPTRKKQIRRSICQGDSIKIGSRFFSQAGQYRRVLQTIHGCDSIVVTTLTVIPVRFHEQSMVITQGDSVRLGGHYRFRAGTYYDTLSSSLGCDSIITTALRVIPSPTDTQQTVTLCEGDSLLVGGHYQKNSGVFYDTLRLANGAKDIVTTTLTVLPRYRQERTVTLCHGGSISLRGTLLTQPGVYYDTLTSSLGCDSVIVTTLQVIDSVATPTVVASQDTLRSSVTGDTYQWFLNGELLADSTATLLPSQEGHYSVTVGIGQCESLPSDSYYYTLPVVTGIPGILPDRVPLRVYRAAAGPYLQVATPPETNRSSVLYIHDLLGNCLYKSEGAVSPAEKLLFSHPEGIYVATLVASGRPTSVKFYWTK